MKSFQLSLLHLNRLIYTVGQLCFRFWIGATYNLDVEILSHSTLIREKPIIYI